MLEKRYTHCSFQPSTNSGPDAHYRVLWNNHTGSDCGAGCNCDSFSRDAHCHRVIHPLTRRGKLRSARCLCGKWLRWCRNK